MNIRARSGLITCSMSCKKPAEIHLQCSHVLSVVASLLKVICLVFSDI